MFSFLRMYSHLLLTKILLSVFPTVSPLCPCRSCSQETLSSQEITFAPCLVACLLAPGLTGMLARSVLACSSLPCYFAILRGGQPSGKSLHGSNSEGLAGHSLKFLGIWDSDTYKSWLFSKRFLIGSSWTHVL